MKQAATWYLCLCVHNYAVQACLRFNRQAADQAVIVIEGTPSAGTIVSVNQAAFTMGLFPGASSLQARLVDGVVVMPRSFAQEQATHDALIQVCTQLTPLIEDCSSSDRCTLILDVTASRHLFTSLDSMAEHLKPHITALGLQVTTSLSSSFHTSRLLGETYPNGECICIPAHHNLAALSGLPVSSLSLNPDQEDTFKNWGISTLKDIAHLPLTDVVSRIGQQAVPIYEMARGEHRHIFKPIHLQGEVKESVAFDTPVDLLDSLLFSISAMLKQLIIRIEAELKAIDHLTIVMGLDNKTTHVRKIRSAIPTTNHTLLLKLVQLDIRAHPPMDSILNITISAFSGSSHRVQLGIFSPQAPEPSQLHVTLARIAALVGQDNLGSPLLEDSHRQTTQAMTSFSVMDPASRITDCARPLMAMTRVRCSIRVLAAGKDTPSRFTYLGNAYQIRQAYGPWSSTGKWWMKHRWDLEQWDVVAVGAGMTDSLYCCLAYDKFSQDWILEGIYD